VFNEEAFRAYDRVLEAANQTGVRVIIPLLDNWWWWGGPKEYAAFRGKSREEFWTDSLLIADFKKTIAHVINRVNTYTGVPFKLDKAVFGWETGNELVCPFSWTKEIASYIKSLDTVHLVIEGTNSREISDDALLEPHIDVLSTHDYGPADRSIPQILKARERAAGRKPYFVGEFGFIPTADMRRMIDTVISTGVSGIMIWSLRGHNRDGGFYYHTNDYRWPGFTSGNAWDETGVISLFREKAYQINAGRRSRSPSRRHRHSFPSRRPARSHGRVPPARPPTSSSEKRRMKFSGRSSPQKPVTPSSATAPSSRTRQRNPAGGIRTGSGEEMPPGIRKNQTR